MFWQRKTPIQSTEFESLSKRIVELDTNFKLLSNKFEILQFSMDTLRKKFRGIKRGDTEETGSDEEPKNLNNPMFLPDHGAFK